MSSDLLESNTQPRWQRRKEARPGEILDAALREFVATGYAGTRLDDIARRAGVTKGTMYLYYENKEALFKAVVHRHLSPESGAFVPSAGLNGGSVRAALEALLRERWDHMVESEASGLVKLLIGESEAFPDLARHCHDAIMQPSCRRIADVLRRGIEAGEFRSDLDMGEVARQALAPVVLGAVWKHSFQRVLPGQSVDPARYFETSLRLLLDAIAVPAVRKAG